MNSCPTCRVLALAWLALCGVGCTPVPGADQLREAARLVQETNLEEAEPLIRDYLYHHPRDPGAHVLLARCYLYTFEVNLTIAAGELETARFWLDQTGDPGPVRTFGEQQDDIRFVIHHDLARTYTRAIYHALENPLPPHALRAMAQRALDNIDAALALQPDHALLRDMRQELRPLVQGGLRSPVRSPRQSALSPAPRLCVHSRVSTAAA